MPSVSSESKTKVLFLSLLLFFVAMILSTYSARNRAIASTGTMIVQEILSPLQNLFRGGQGFVTGLWDRYIALREVETENQQLRQRLLALEAQNSELLELQNDNLRLGELLSVRQTIVDRDVLVANVIGFDATNTAQTISLDQGTRAGVSPGMAVIEGNGVVGQVIAAGPWSSRVLLVTDYSSSVDGIIQSNRARGLVEGAGPFRCTWRFVLTNEEVQIGDRVITSGMDAVFPKGLLIGVVAEISEGSGNLFKRVELNPSVDFSHLEKVLIIRSKKGD